MSGYVYIKSEKAGSWTDGLGRRESWGDLWTVGFYDPKGEWHSESDHKTSEAAAERVAYLNGAASHESKVTPAVPQCRDCGGSLSVSCSCDHESKGAR